MALFPRVQHRMAPCHSSARPVECPRVLYHSSVHPVVYLKVRCRLSVHPTVGAGRRRTASRLPAVCPSRTGVDDETALPLDGVEVLCGTCVQPAIMIPAMRIADAINMTIMLFFME